MPYGVLQTSWNKAKNEAKQLMIERAKVRETIPYSDLAREIKAVKLAAHDQRLFHLIGEISTEEDGAGRGMLSVVVVHKTGDRQPGPGFFELASLLGRDTSDIMKCWAEELERVYRVWSS